MSEHDSSNSTSTSLIQRVRDFDAAAWQRLCEIYGPLVYRWARAKGLQDTDAADVGQEVFRTVANRINEFRRDRPGDTFRGWLWTITHYKLGDFLRDGKIRPDAVGGTTNHQRFHDLAGAQDKSPESTESWQDPFKDEGDREVLHRALRLIRVEFTEGTWKAFWKATVEGRTTADIAAELGISPQAVRQAKYKVIKRLRDEMRDDTVA